MGITTSIRYGLARWLCESRRCRRCRNGRDRLSHPDIRQPDALRLWAKRDSNALYISAYLLLLPNRRLVCGLMAKVGQKLFKHPLRGNSCATPTR